MISRIVSVLGNGSKFWLKIGLVWLQIEHFSSSFSSSSLTII